MTTLKEWVVEAAAGIADIFTDHKDEEASYVGQPWYDREFQYDGYSCGARSTYSVLRHFGRPATYQAVKKGLGTDEEGTTSSAMQRYLRRRGLSVRADNNMTLRTLEQALADSAVVMTFIDGDHVGVVYGISKKHVFLADPSLLRSPRSRIPRRLFSRRWDHMGLIVREK